MGREDGHWKAIDRDLLAIIRDRDANTSAGRHWLVVIVEPSGGRPVQREVSRCKSCGNKAEE